MKRLWQRYKAYRAWKIRENVKSAYLMRDLVLYRAHEPHDSLGARLEFLLAIDAMPDEKLFEIYGGLWWLP